MSLLPENADETGLGAERVAAIARTGREVIINEAAIALHDG